MAMTSKSAGEARQRPRPAHAAPEVAVRGEVVIKNAGGAPVFDAERQQLAARPAPAMKGMAANPLVQRWTSAGPETEPETPRHESGRKSKAATGGPKRKQRPK